MGRLFEANQENRTRYRKGMEGSSLARAKAELIVGKIAIEEKIEPTEAELEHETTHLLEHYKRCRSLVYGCMSTP